MTSKARRSPIRYSDFGVPASWYRVAWSADLESGDVRPLKYFGQDLVLYRTEAGQAVVLDAFCQHLGAHLGFGGVVEKDCIVCPFHGWSWMPDGANGGIPYAPRPARRRITPWEVREANGIVWVWYDPYDGKPTFEIPQLPELADGSYTQIDEVTRKVWSSVGVHPLQTVENTVDPAHVRFVHGAGVIPDVDDFRAEDTTFRTFLRYEWGAGKPPTWLTPDGPVEGVLNADCHGLGLIITTYSGIWPTIQFTGVTPVDAERSDFFTTVMVKVGAQEDFRERMAHHFFRNVEDDIPIWENMAYIQNPPLPRLESKVMRDLRAWSKQFLVTEESVLIGSS